MSTPTQRAEVTAETQAATATIPGQRRNTGTTDGLAPTNPVRSGLLTAVAALAVVVVVGAGAASVATDDDAADEPLPSTILFGGRPTDAGEPSPAAKLLANPDTTTTMAALTPAERERTFLRVLAADRDLVPWPGDNAAWVAAAQRTCAELPFWSAGDTATLATTVQGLIGHEPRYDRSVTAFLGAAAVAYCPQHKDAALAAGA